MNSSTKIPFTTVNSLSGLCLALFGVAGCPAEEPTPADDTNGSTGSTGGSSEDTTGDARGPRLGDRLQAFLFPPSADLRPLQSSTTGF